MAQINFYKVQKFGHSNTCTNTNELQYNVQYCSVGMPTLG